MFAGKIILLFLFAFSVSVIHVSCVEAATRTILFDEVIFPKATGEDAIALWRDKSNVTHTNNIAPENSSVTTLIQEAAHRGLGVEVEVEKYEPYYIKAAKVNPKVKSKIGNSKKKLTSRPEAIYRPSVVTLDQAKEIFSQLRPIKEPLIGNTDCFNRAHVWSFESEKKLGVKMQKVLLAYTKRYRDESKSLGQYGNGRWIFHIVPYLLVKEGDSTPVPMVLDRTFADRPMKLQSWAKMFVELPRPQGNDEIVRCPEITNFSDYLKNAGPSSPEYCYLRTQLPMYLYAINELIDMDFYGIFYRQWEKKELVWAAKDALPSGSDIDHWVVTGEGKVK